MNRKTLRLRKAAASRKCRVHALKAGDGSRCTLRNWWHSDAFTTRVDASVFGRGFRHRLEENGRLEQDVTCQIESPV
jgi:hypothetical protein